MEKLTTLGIGCAKIVFSMPGDSSAVANALAAYELAYGGKSLHMAADVSCRSEAAFSCAVKRVMRGGAGGWKRKERDSHHITAARHDVSARGT